MKRILSLLLAAVLLVSAVPTAFAADTNSYTQGTQVTFTAANNESYTITVPAMLAPGGSGTVTLSGQWPDNRTVAVTADPTVTLTNSIKATDIKTLDVNFTGISEAGSNIEAQTFTKSISVDPIENAIFGTWSGKFNYNVETTTAAIAPILEGDGQVFFTALPETLSFRSTAPINEFQEVKVNGVTVDPSNYTVTEGSTIITLHEDYLMTLGAEAHQITVVSDSGSPSAGFSVRDTITYEEGDYIYTIMQDGFETLEEARTYYKIWVENQFDITWDDLVAEYGGDENYVWEQMVAWTGGVGLTEVTFVAKDNPVKYWSVAVKDRTLSVYGEIDSGLLGYPVNDMYNTFGECVHLTEAPSIPNVDIMISTFYGCTSLESVVIPNGVSTLVDVFADCTSLKNVVIADSVTTFDGLVFANCTSLATIIFGGTVDQWNAITKVAGGGWSWNQGCSEITVTCTDGTVIVPAYGS